MAEESPSGGEKTEDPTSKRRSDFRNKGQVAQSKEVHTAALLTLVLLFWIFYMGSFWDGLSALLASLWQNVGVIEVTPSSTMQLAYFISAQLAKLLLPLLAFVTLIGIFSSYFQIGWVFTTKPLVPTLSKFDPIQGSKKFISKKAALDLIKSVFKVMLIGYIAYSTIYSKFNEALLLSDTSTSITLLFLAETAALILAKVCAILILIGFIDFLFVKWEMEEKMKMTKQEVKEEFKEAEGDPRIKAQIRTIQREMAQRRMMADVPEADVIITNPTHISIAVKYENESMDAPIIVAKGADHVAMKIREIARDHDIPIIENPPVARLLHKIELGQHIPEEMFKAVAEILAHVYKLKGKVH